MNFDWIKEGIGYAASLIILVSLLMTNVFRLRVINGIGSVLFGAYGWLIGSWPVCVINLVIAGIDGWYLLQTLTSGAFFDLAPASSVAKMPGSPLVGIFFTVWKPASLRMPIV